MKWQLGSFQDPGSFSGLVAVDCRRWQDRSMSIAGVLSRPRSLTGVVCTAASYRLFSV